MDWLKRKRIKQVRQYGWQDAKAIALVSDKSRLAVWMDIVKCFKRYYLFSNQYKTKEVWKLGEDEREALAKTLGDKNRYREECTIWKYENAAFIHKYSSKWYSSTPERYNKRIKAYKERYNLGEGVKVSDDVTI